MAGKSAGGSSKKKGRNAVSCAAYKLRRQSEKNKIKRLKKRLLDHPEDKAAANRLAELKKVVGL